MGRPRRREHTQIETVTTEAASRGITVTSSSTSSTSLNICGRPPGPSSTKASPPPRNGSLTRHARSSAASPRRSRPGSAAVPPPTVLPGRARRCRRVRPLPGQQEGLPWLRHRAGERLAHSHRSNRGAARWLVKDRMDITGARWGLQGAEAILKLRALIASGTSTPTGASTSAASTNTSTTPDTATDSSSQRNQLTSKEPYLERYAKLPLMILLHRADLRLPRSLILKTEGFA